MLYKMGEMKVLPDIFGRVYEGTRVPLFSTLFVWTCSVVLLLIAQYELLDYVQLSLLLVFAWLITWGVAIVAAIKYRREHPIHVEKQDWKQPLFPLFPVLGMVGVAVILYGTFAGAVASFGLGIVFLIAIFAIYYFYGRHRMDEAQILTVLNTDQQPNADD